MRVSLDRHWNGIHTKYCAEGLMYQSHTHSKIFFVNLSISMIECCLFSSTLVGLAVPTRKSKSFMDKATKLNFIAASHPVVEEPLPVGYMPAPSSQRQSVTEQQSDDNDSVAVDDGGAEENEEAVKQVSKIRKT